MTENIFTKNGFVKINDHNCVDGKARWLGQFCIFIPIRLSIHVHVSIKQIAKQ